MIKVIVQLFNYPRG